MNENAKTVLFVGVAAVAALFAWISRPGLRTETEQEFVGEELFPDFKDPREAASLEIVQFNESTAKIRPFHVAQVNGEWSIPSHHNYPADAEKQLGEAAASLVGLKILDVVTQSPGDHKLYGVVDPDIEKLKLGDTGVGMRVTMRDANEKPLLSIIVGKAAKEVPGGENLRYVRRTGSDPVFIAELKTDKLSTKFEDWIEKDLLKLNTSDIRKVTIRDYSADIQQVVDLARGVIRVGLDQIQRSLMTLEYDDKDYKWKLADDKVFDQKTKDWVEMKMAEDEELNTSKLNDMKWALDGLKIVDVAQKPEGLSETLKATGEVDPKAAESLAARGFYLLGAKDDRELISSEGEILVLMKDGVQYVLRFGQIAGAEEKAAGAEEAEAVGKQPQEGEEETKEADAAGVNRYLFVMAEFNPEIIPKPELEPLPGETETSNKKPGEAEASDASASKPEASDGDGAEAEAAEAKTEGAQAARSETANKEAAQGERAEAQSQADASTEKKTSDQQASKPEAKEKDKQNKKSELQKERERVEKENKRKQEEYDKKVKDGKEHVQKLNERFADWYYVISDDEYKKIHLGRDDVVKKKEKEKEKAGVKEGPEDETKDEAAGEVKAEPKPPQEKPAQKQEAKGQPKPPAEQAAPPAKAPKPSTSAATAKPDAQKPQP
jgi:hypothetical protein